MMRFMRCLTEVDGREQGENECLQERHEQFDAIHENHEQSGEDAHAISGHRRRLPEDEDQADEGQDDDVTRGDVRRQTNHQHNGLQEHPNDFNRNDDGHNEDGHPWRPEQVTPVMFVAVQAGQQKHESRHDHGDAHGSRDVESTNEWDQTKQVGEEDEEEHRQQEGQKLLGLLFSQTWNGNVISHEHHEGFKHVGQSRRRLPWALLVTRSRPAKQEHQECHDEQHPENRLRDAQVRDVLPAMVVSGVVTSQGNVAVRKHVFCAVRKCVSYTLLSMLCVKKDV